jgi:hypothetical protein
MYSLVGSMPMYPWCCCGGMGSNSG